MARNGSGTYSLYAGNPIASGSTSNSTLFNNTLSDIATALTGSLAKDGQTVPTANLPMGGFKHTGVAVAAALTDYARASQVQNSTFTYLTSVAGTNTVTATAALTMAAYAVGQKFHFIPAGANTGATTLNINSIGAGAVQLNGAALTGGELTTTNPVEVIVIAATPVFEIVSVHKYAAKVATGTYTGDGQTSMPITGLGFAPKYVKIWQRLTADATAGRIYETTDTIVDDNASGGAWLHLGTGGHTFETNAIIALGSDGFTVDDNGAPNEAPNTLNDVYNYLAIG